MSVKAVLTGVKTLPECARQYIDSSASKSESSQDLGTRKDCSEDDERMRHKDPSDQLVASESIEYSSPGRLPMRADTMRHRR
jgi:hypothetical protein